MLVNLLQIRIFAFLTGPEGEFQDVTFDRRGVWFVSLVHSSSVGRR
jgi:hypothetical protein